MPEEFPDLRIVERVGCTLQIYGEGFVPHDFLLRSAIPKDQMLFSGRLGDEFSLKGSESQMQIVRDHYLVIEVSRANDPVDQIRDAAGFLEQYCEALTPLRSYKGVEALVIQFIHPFEPADYYDNLPDHFYALYSRIGITSIVFRGLNVKSNP